MFDDMCDVENGAIIGWDVGCGGEEEVAASTAASFWFAKMAGITVGSKDHITGMVGENGFFLSGEVVK